MAFAKKNAASVITIQNINLFMLTFTYCSFSLALIKHLWKVAMPLWEADARYWYTAKHEVDRKLLPMHTLIEMKDFNFLIIQQWPMRVTFHSLRSTLFPSKVASFIFSATSFIEFNRFVFFEVWIFLLKLYFWSRTLRPHSIKLLYFDSFVVKVYNAAQYTYTHIIIQGIWSKHQGKIRARVQNERNRVMCQQWKCSFT